MPLLPTLRSQSLNLQLILKELLKREKIGQQVKLTSPAAKYFQDIFLFLTKKIIKNCLILLDADNKKTILNRHVLQAIKITIPEIYEKCEKVLNQHVTTYLEMKKAKEGQGDRKSRSSKGDVIFPAWATKRWRNLYLPGKPKIRVSDGVDILLAALFQYIFLFIMEVAVKHLTHETRVMIGRRDVQWFIKERNLSIRLTPTSE